MNKALYSFVAVVVLALVSVLAGCSDFDEMKSKRALLDAEALMEQGREEDAMQALSGLIALYPATHSGDVAKKHLVRIERQRERRERLAITRLLDSYRQVLNGFYSLYNEYPQAISDLGESGYFFDADYLEEVIPPGHVVYLWLKEDGSGYRVWGAIEEKELGYTMGSENYVFAPFETQTQIGKLNKQFASEDWGGPLVLLRQKD